MTRRQRTLCAIAETVGIQSPRIEQGGRKHPKKSKTVLCLVTEREKPYNFEVMVDGKSVATLTYWQVVEAKKQHEEWLDGIVKKELANAS